MTRISLITAEKGLLDVQADKRAPISWAAKNGHVDAADAMWANANLFRTAGNK